MDNKAPDAFRTISEVADELDLPQHVLRFWESRFRDIKPMKRGGGRRYYRPQDIDLLRGIKHLLYGEGYTIRGVQRILREQSVGFVQAVWQDGAPQPPHSGEAAGHDDDNLADDIVDDDADMQVADEPRGLRGHLSNLLGRDLGDRGEIHDGRRDPPLQSAPMPRIDPSDRVIPNVDFEDGEPVPLHVVAAPRQPQSPMQTATVAPSAPSAGLPPDSVRKLHDALHELDECRKLLADALTRSESDALR